jgi:hypothetical protein
MQVLIKLDGWWDEYSIVFVSSRPHSTSDDAFQHDNLPLREKFCWASSVLSPGVLFEHILTVK